jgi:hypothetical protein
MEAPQPGQVSASWVSPLQTGHPEVILLTSLFFYILWKDKKIIQISIYPLERGFLLEKMS